MRKPRRPPPGDGLTHTGAKMLAEQLRTHWAGNPAVKIWIECIATVNRDFESEDETLRLYAVRSNLVNGMPPP